MCGIVGKVCAEADQPAIAEALGRMNDAIVHRGPDSAGTHTAHGVGIGMRRLSIIDVQGGQQPISNETGSIHVVCNGEIYNHRELRGRLEAQGHRFTTKSDAEVIVHLYEEYGEACFAHLRGMFGLAIMDEDRNQVLVARDRLGKKPLFFAQHDQTLWFASEMKAILRDAPQLDVVNPTVLGHFFQFGYISAPETIYQSIYQLPAGTFGVWNSQSLQIKEYWQLPVPCGEESSASLESWLEQLDSKLQEAVRIRLQSEVPLGVFLSGGLDSSAMVAYCHEAGLSPLKTFTIGFDRSEWDESDDALRVARHFGTDHHVLKLCEEDLRSSFDATLQAILHHCDEPFGDASALPTYHVCQLAREHVTVILSGDGGDELFGGYTSYRGALFANRYRSYLPGWLARTLPTLAHTASRGTVGSLRYRLQRIAKVLRDSALPFSDGYRSKSSIWNLDQLSTLFTPGLQQEANFMGHQYMPDDLWAVFEQAKSSTDLVKRLMHIDIHSYMRDDILVKVDRMSMAHSLEVRCPLLDHEIVELAAQLPLKWKIRGNVGKFALRELLKRRLPSASIRKGKQGFSVPLRDWFRGGLRDLVHDRLLSRDLLPADLFQRAAVESTLREHDQGVADHGRRIWLLLTFATWNEMRRNRLHSQSSAREVVPCES